MCAYYVGIDIGSTTTKAVLIDEDKRVLDFAISDTASDRFESGSEVFNIVMARNDLARDEIASVGATGYGRRALGDVDKVTPEILCHAVGTESLCPGVGTIIDVGGQDSKVIECSDGIVLKFEMNDKCAAGTGRFFEVLSHRLLGVSMEELGSLALQSTDPVRLSAMCTVFAESEVVSMLSNGVLPADIARGMIEAMFRRIIAMAASSGVQIKEPIILSGGVAKNEGSIPILENMLGK